MLRKSKRVRLRYLSACNVSIPGKSVTSQRIPPVLKENQKKTVTSFPPLSESIPNLPKAVYSTEKEEHQTTLITVLPNGLKVASENSLRRGLFCIHGSYAPSHVKEMVEVIVHEMVAMTSGFSDNKLARAKKELLSMLLMNLEQRPVVFGDIGRQFLATGTRKRPEYFMQAINGISKDDINRVAQRLLKSPPCLTARGEVTPNVRSQIQLNLENMIRDASCFRCRTKILIIKITEFSNIITGLLKIVILEGIVLMSKI
ncbi:uncharacterized protein [Temnothorax longispinosus]|uniref:uncharacterized protein n=1 Tax=Temnothorax longispinosus TaxID=300112 RepID=UPI003A98D7C0